MLESTGLPSQLLGLDNEQILEFQLQKATLLLLSRFKSVQMLYILVGGWFLAPFFILEYTVHNTLSYRLEGNFIYWLVHDW